MLKMCVFSNRVYKKTLDIEMVNEITQTLEIINKVNHIACRLAVIQNTKDTKSTVMKKAFNCSLKKNLM